MSGKPSSNTYNEDIEDLYLTERALDKIRNNEEKTIPLKEVMKRSGSQR